MLDIAQSQPDGQFRDATIAMLIREVLFTPPAPGESFSADVVDEVRELAEQVELRPGGLRLNADDDESLRKALSESRPDPAVFQELVEEVRQGRTSLINLARFAHQSYGTALLQRPAGIQPAADLAEGLRQAGEEAAERAIQLHSCVADLSSLHLLGLVGDDDRLRIRSALRDMVVTRTSVNDAILTRDHMRGLAVATYSASLRPDGTVERVALTPVERAMLPDRAEALESTVVSAQARVAADPDEESAGAIALARETGLPLWCDDSFLRQRARAAGVSTFSLLDLVTCLGRHGISFDNAAMFERLADNYVVDLPLGAADVIELASRHEWDRGPAHTALARSGWWRYQAGDWGSTWLQIATAAVGHSTAALLEITKAALAGSLDHVTGGYRTQRYQEVVVFALVACHSAGRQSPDDLLAELAQFTGDAVAPQPQFVLAALARELEARSVQQPELVAEGLLPGVDFPAR